MIDRDQVLHVARLARLELTEAEVERMAGELSHVLEHIEQIARARPRGRPADLARRRRRQPRCAPTSRGPSLAPETALAAGARRRGGRLPRASPAAA